MNILDEIRRCFKQSCKDLAKKLKKINKELEEIVEAAAKNPKTSVLVAQHLKVREDLLEKLLKGALKSPKYAYGFFFSVKIPEKLRKKYLKKAAEAASKDPIFAYRFLKNIRPRDKRLRKILAEGVARNAKYSYRAGIDLLQKAPELLLRELLEPLARGASKDPRYAYYFFLAIWVPPDMRKKIYGILFEGVKGSEFENAFIEELSQREPELARELLQDSELKST